MRFYNVVLTILINSEKKEQAEDEDGKKVLKLCKLAKKMVSGFESQTSARIDENLPNY